MNQPSLILFATNQPLLVAGFHDVLRRAGFDAEPVMRGPQNALDKLRREDACLIFVDASDAPDSVTLAQAVSRAPQSRFVLCGSDITTDMVQIAVDSGMHGVLSAGLPVEEGANALARIWHGGAQEEGLSEQVNHRAPPPPANIDFDSEWMFGYVA